MKIIKNKIRHITVFYIVSKISLVVSNIFKKKNNINNYSKSIIYSYRIEQAIASNFVQNTQKNEIITFKKITYAVDIHRKAMKLVFTCT